MLALFLVIPGICLWVIHGVIQCMHGVSMIRVGEVLHYNDYAPKWPDYEHLFFA